jgi:hypothetical protein
VISREAITDHCISSNRLIFFQSSLSLFSNHSAANSSRILVPCRISHKLREPAWEFQNRSVLTSSDKSVASIGDNHGGEIVHQKAMHGSGSKRAVLGPFLIAPFRSSALFDVKYSTESEHDVKHSNYRVSGDNEHLETS